MDQILRSRIRQSQHGVRCTFDASTGDRRFRYLSVRIADPKSGGDRLATAAVCLGSSPEEVGRGPARIVIRFPVAWQEQRRQETVTSTMRPLASYCTREPLVWDLVTLMLQPGHSHTLIESAAAALVCCVLQAEADLVPRRRTKTQAPR